MASAQSTSPCDLDSETARAVQGADWTTLEQRMNSNQLSDQQKAKIIVGVTRSADGQQFSRHIRPFCSSGQLDAAMEQLVSAGLWTDVVNLCQFAGHDHSEWRVGDLSINDRLLSVVAEGKWRELGRVFQDDLCCSPAQKRWAVLQACQRAGQLEIIEDVLPHCAQGDWDGVLQPLAKRGLWWAVGSVLRQPGAVSESQRARAMDQAAEAASPWELSEFILPHCNTRQLTFLSRQLVRRRLWWALDHLLKKDVHVFSQCVLQACGNADTDLFMSHLLTEGLLDSAQRLLHIVGNQKLQWKLGEANIHVELIHLAAEGRWVNLLWRAEGTGNPEVFSWATDHVSRRAEEDDIEKIISVMCHVNQIPLMVKNLVHRGFFHDAAILFCQLVNRSVDKRNETTKTSDFVFMLRGGKEDETSKEALWSLLTKSSFALKDISELFTNVQELERWDKYLQDLSIFPEGSLETSSPGAINKILGKVLYISALSTVIISMCDKLNALPLPQSIDDQVQLTVTRILEEDISDQADLSQRLRRLHTEFKSMTRKDNASYPLFALSFITAVRKYLTSQDQSSCSIDFLAGQDQSSLYSMDFLTYLATVPVVPEIQRNALRVMMEGKVWDTLRVSDLSCVGEQVRRLLFWSAVRQKQWSLVRQWADHTLPDDQRRWALELACKDQQWDVCLRVAEHGLTEDELTHLHCRVAQNAAREVVLHLYEHESDVVEVKQQLTQSKLQMAKVGETEELLSEVPVLLLAEIEARLKSRLASFRTLEQAVAEGDWQVVVFAIRQRPGADSVSLVLTAAVTSQAWSAVKELVRLGIPVCDQQPLFVDMVRQQQWGVCRVMVEQGLSAEHYTQFIPQLMEMDQWTLVGEMMHYETDDAVRRQVMQRALQRKEGSVVSQCITGMKQQLSIQEREDVFHRAIVGGVLQAVVPLVTVKDDTGTRHRDMAFLRAINQQQWDVVDHCLCQYADINTPDDRGDLPVHRAAQDDDWETVLALAERGADLYRLDSTRLSVLHRATITENWSYVKKLVLFCDDLQRSATHKMNKRTLLQILIRHNQKDTVAVALSQNTRQWRGVSSKGETTLHTICLAGWHEYIHSLLLQGVNPLSVTHRGHSALSYAVLCKNHTQATVAACISLGFSTHQPHITQTIEQTRQLFLSPVLFAVLLGLPVVTRMLYETGSCSSKEMFQILPNLLQLTLHDFDTTSSTSPLVQSFKTELAKVQFVLQRESWMMNCVVDRRFTIYAINEMIRQAALYLTRVCTAPRSLKSMCRLVVSHCVRISGTRHEDISQLPIPNSLQDYVSFADLTRPDYGEGESQWVTDE